MKFTLCDTIKQCRVCTPSTIKIEFSFVNMDEVEIEYKVTMLELYKDWWGECDLCPPNDTELSTLIFYTPGGYLFNVDVNGLSFEELMESIQANWKFVADIKE